MISKKSILACLLLITLLPACSETTKNNTTTLSYEDRQLAADLIDKQVIQAENTFGMQLLQEIRNIDDGDNLVISPYSISTALAIAYNGSSGDTSIQMAKALGWSEITLEKLNQANEHQRKLLEGSDEDIELSIANSLWYKEGFEIRPSFLNTSENSYKAEIYAKDDMTSSQTMDQINHWVQKNTNNRITSLLNEPLSPDTLSILMNAIYFKGAWEYPFSEDHTVEQPFQLEDGSNQQVNMMQQTNTFPYLETEDWQAIRLPYGDGLMSMLLILPSKQSTLDTLTQQLLEDPSPWQQSFDTTNVHIGLPRFKVEYRKQLNEVLQTLGLKDAFDPEMADFSQMSTTKPLSINEVLHKTFLEVNEKGAEAAAVTGVFITGSAAPISPVEMTLDRPFFFAIEDTQSKAWLFIGMITKP